MIEEREKEIQSLYSLIETKDAQISDIESEKETSSQKNQEEMENRLESLRRDLNAKYQDYVSKEELGFIK